MHVNIASLNKHIDDLKTTLVRLKHSFDIIGISEHKIQKGTQTLNNINIPGYNEFLFEPTETTHGGTGFYIKNNIDYIERQDLNFSKSSNFETCFIELIFPNRKNLVIGCMYRHPSSEITVNDFSNDFLESVLEKVRKGRDKKNAYLWATLIKIYLSGLLLVCQI